MKSKLLNPGTLFVTALIVMILAIPLAQVQLSRVRGDDVPQVLLWRAG
ncbi:hypothetical protein [Shinella sp. WSJ-2]|nr:hypothetical protein [Shinella sp. WSJ-2]MBO9628764.1 hypothetical protein [Shinella sp.]